MQFGSWYLSQKIKFWKLSQNFLISGDINVLLEPPPFLVTVCHYFARTPSPPRPVTYFLNGPKGDWVPHKKFAAKWRTASGSFAYHRELIANSKKTWNGVSECRIEPKRNRNDNTSSKFLLCCIILFFQIIYVNPSHIHVVFYKHGRSHPRQSKAYSFTGRKI